MLNSRNGKRAVGSSEEDRALHGWAWRTELNSSEKTMFKRGELGKVMKFRFTTYRSSSIKARLC